jgi:hypothetical protein
LSAESSSEHILVGQVILQNAANERQFGSEQRLFAFPLQTTVAGAWRHYDIRWTIQNTRTGQVVWSTISRSSHMNWIRTDENSTRRARVIVEGLVSQMAASGLVR